MEPSKVSSTASEPSSRTTYVGDLIEDRTMLNARAYECIGNRPAPEVSKRGNTTRDLPPMAQSWRNGNRRKARLTRPGILSPRDETPPNFPPPAAMGGTHAWGFVRQRLRVHDNRMDTVVLTSNLPPALTPLPYLRVGNPSNVQPMLLADIERGSQSRPSVQNPLQNRVDRLLAEQSVC